MSEQMPSGPLVAGGHLSGAGHTKGCTTWTFDETQDGRTLHVLVLCGVSSSAGPDGSYKLLNNSEYPQIASDLAHSLRSASSTAEKTCAANWVCRSTHQRDDTACRSGGCI
jgi:metallo-beta-lactamase class B